MSCLHNNNGPTSPLSQCFIECTGHYPPPPFHLAPIGVPGSSGNYLIDINSNEGKNLLMSLKEVQNLDTKFVTLLSTRISRKSKLIGILDDRYDPN